MFLRDELDGASFFIHFGRVGGEDPFAQSYRNNPSFQLLTSLGIFTALFNHGNILIIQFLNFHGAAKATLAGEAIVHMTVQLFIYNEPFPKICKTLPILVHLLDPHIRLIPRELCRFTRSTGGQYIDKGKSESNFMYETN